MLKHQLGSFAIVCASFSVLACGDDSGDGGPGGSNGLPPPFSGGTGGAGQVINISGSGNQPAGGGAFDGGTAPLTPKEAEVIRNDTCASWMTEAEIQPAMLELVVDVSSSMNNVAPGPSGMTRWEIAREALLEAVVGVNGPGLPPSVAVGLLFYPGQMGAFSTMPQDVSNCVNTGEMVPPELLGNSGSAHRDRLQSAIEGAALVQSTPTHDAYHHALQEGLIPQRFSGQKYMLLITDGEPTVSLGCVTQDGMFTGSAVDAQPIVDEIASAAEDENIKTFLIGVPGSEANRNWMSRAARLGGTPQPDCTDNGSNGKYCHLDMTTAPDFSVALRNGLNQVLGVVSPCSFSFAEPPDGMEIDPNKINVLLNDGEKDTLVIRDDVDECDEGWQLIGSNEILLCPATCEQVQSDPNISVDLTFGCRSYREPPIVE
jgi:hypothetical protein